jgi:hypothetical protein
LSWNAVLILPKQTARTLLVPLHGSTDKRIDMIYRAGSTDALIAGTFIAQIILLDVLGNSAFASQAQPSIGGQPSTNSTANFAPNDPAGACQPRRCSVKREGGRE